MSRSTHFGEESLALVLTTQNKRESIPKTQNKQIGPR